jgi:hypothetical protein
MIEFDKYITDTIDKHQKEFGLYFSNTAREVIKEAIIKGIYAFNIIYESRNSYYQLTELTVSEIKYLDYKLCVHENILGLVDNMMWSYDGGHRFQWSEMETLIFDPSVIRNIKLKEVLNDNN